MIFSSCSNSDKNNGGKTNSITKSITGTLFTTDSVPLEKVIVSAEKYQDIDITDSRGQFRLELEDFDDDKVTLIFEKEGYKKEEREYSDLGPIESEKKCGGIFCTEIKIGENTNVPTLIDSQNTDLEEFKDRNEHLNFKIDSLCSVMDSLEKRLDYEIPTFSKENDVGIIISEYKTSVFDPKCYLINNNLLYHLYKEAPVFVKLSLKVCPILQTIETKQKAESIIDTSNALMVLWGKADLLEENSYLTTYITTARIINVNKIFRNVPIHYKGFEDIFTGYGEFILEGGLLNSYKAILYILKGTLLIRQNLNTENIDEIIKIFETAEEISQNLKLSDEINCYIGRAYIHKIRYLNDKIIDLRSTTGNRNINVEKLVKSERDSCIDKAKEYLKKSISQPQSKFAFGYFSLGNLYDELGDSTNSIINYRIATNLEKDLIIYVYALTEILERYHRFDECYSIIIDYLKHAKNIKNDDRKLAETLLGRYRRLKEAKHAR